MITFPPVDVNKVASNISEGYAEVRIYCEAQSWPPAWCFTEDLKTKPLNSLVSGSVITR